MSAVKIMAIVLIISGVLGLVLGQFSYPQETQQSQLTPLEQTVKETGSVNVAVWAGVGAIVTGSGLLFVVSRKD